MKSRKEKALQLAEREAIAENKHKLTEALSQKILLKHSSKKRRCSKKQIVLAIHNFFEKYPSLVKVSSLRHVGDLEKSLSAFLEKFPITTEKSGSEEGEATVKVLESSGDSKALNKASSQNCSEHEGDVKNDINPWAMIEKFQILEMKESKRKKQHMSELKKKRMAKALKDQIKLKEEAEQVEKEKEDRNLQIQQNKISQKWEEEQKLISGRDKEKVEQLKKFRKEQIKDNDERKNKHLAETREEDLREIQEISKALKKEEEDKLEKKKKEREKWERNKAENAKKLELRRMQKVEEERIDAKLMAESTAKMDLEEAKRTKAIEERTRKLEQNRRTLNENEPDQLLLEGMTSVEYSMNKKVLEDAQAFLGSRSVL